jgi:electron transport complex protein RnfE
MNLFKEFSKGIFKENPTFVLMLGMCPTLAVTSNAINGCSMGLATLFVLAGSNMVISLIRNVVPKKVRIPCYIVVIAAFVTVVDLLLQAYAPAAIYEALGIFIPLIVVNCIVLGRAEAFACKNGIIASLADGLGMGLGFTLSLTMIGGLRELLSSGSLFEIKLIEGWTQPFMLMSQAPGAFILLGILLGLINWMNQRKAKKAGRPWSPPGLDCRQCNLCDLGKK